MGHALLKPQTYLYVKENDANLLLNMLETMIFRMTVDVFGGCYGLKMLCKHEKTSQKLIYCCEIC